MFGFKVKYPSLRKGGSSKEQNVNNVNIVSKLNVKDEYMEALRTKSYIDIWSKVQGQLRKTSTPLTTNNDVVVDVIDRIATSISRIPSYTHISDYLLEPQQEVLLELIQKSNLHQLLIDYFEASLEACRICGSILKCIDQARANYCKIQRVIKLSKRVPSDLPGGISNEDKVRIIFGELASFAKLDNPLSNSSKLKFSIIHDRYGSMLNLLTVKRKKVARRVKVISLSKKAWGVSVVMLCSGLAIATIILAVHSLVGFVAVPGLMCMQLGYLKKKLRSAKNGLKRNKLNQFHNQLDAAAKGVYTLNSDFDTISRLVMRLHDEIEHGKSIAQWCVKTQKKQMLKEVIKEFQTQENCFLEKLGELEEHVYLCVLTINRARRLVIKEINCMKTSPQQH
ncbi:hypothetical protein C5167_010451 [Papaver somniferum]|uniref:Uncharacterized protein n=1 Tax=Papaver somniferum TaxID=3469 RepID=A0A4Y7K3C6_PAPSO|nr:UPF0496 protein At1g20180-like [Papaver somniferum]RZC66761.1 hypothetical protein C5167_010451 [Papaver somniferum]